MEARKRHLGVLCGLAMMLGLAFALMPGMTQTAYAAFWDGDDSPTITITESETINESVNIYSADITLTINRGVTLTINADEVRGGITAKGQTLTVTGGGKLVVKAADNNSVGGTGAEGGNATSSAAPGGQGVQGGQGGQGGAAMAGRDGGSISIIVDEGTEVELIGGAGGTGGTGGAGGTGYVGAQGEEGSNGGDGGKGGTGGTGGAGIAGDVTVINGSIKAIGGQGGQGGQGGTGGQAGSGSYGSKSNGKNGGSGDQGSPGSAITGTITGNAQVSDDGSTWTVISSGGTSTKQYAKVTSPHTHSFTYSASGATITAECSADDCPLTDGKATLTITAPTLTTYGGSGSAEATVTGSIDGVKTPAVAYAKGGEALASAPTDAGDYTASITLGGATASVEYTIAKADPTTNAPTATATYGDTLGDVALENPEGNTPGTWAWVDPADTSVGDAGGSTFKANFTPDDAENYNAVSGVDVAVTVNKAANPATVAPTATVRSGSNSVDLAGNVALNGATGEVSYQIEGEAHECELEGSVLTSGFTASTVTVNVTVTVAQDANHDALEPKTIAVTVVSIPVTGLAVNPASATLTVGDRLQLGFEYTPEDATDLSLDWDDYDHSVVEVDGAGIVSALGDGTVTLTARATNGTADRSDDATATFTVTVVKPAASVTQAPAAKDLTYSSSAQELVGEGAATGGTMRYALGTDATTKPADTAYAASIPTATDAGTYFVWYKAAGDADHRDSEPACVEATVAPADISGARVVLAKSSFAYDGKAKKPAVKSVTLDGEPLAASDYTVKYSGNKKVGTATAAVTGKGNYAGAAAATFTIAPGKAKLSTGANIKAKAMDLTWAKVKGAKSYQVQWRERGGKWRTKTVKSSKATVKATLGGMKSGKLYDYRVRAVAGKSKGAWSAERHRWFVRQAGVAAKSKKAGTVKVTWDKTAKADAGYLVTVRYSRDGEAVAKKPVAAGKTSATITGLAPGKTAWVHVRAIRSAGGASYPGALTHSAKSVVKVAGKPAKAKAQSAAQAAAVQPQSKPAGALAAASI